MEPRTCGVLCESKPSIPISPNFGNCEIRDLACLLPTAAYPLLSWYIILIREASKTSFMSFSPFILKAFRQQYLL